MAKLYFYYSAMNAGKTTTLLQSGHNYRERGMRVAILTPALDHRAGSGTVASRIGLSAEAVGFGPDDDLEARVRADIAAHGPLHCVLVDEAQFLSRSQVWQLSEVVDALRIPVLCYGLRTDFRGELFEGSRYLLAWADELTEVVDALRIPVLCYGLRTDFRGELFEGSAALLAWADELSEIKTICHTGSKATMTVRVDDKGRALQEGPQVEIGGNERYVSVSRAEFKKIARGEGRIDPQQPGLLLE